MWSEQAARNSIALIAVTAVAFAGAFAVGAVTRSGSSPSVVTSLAPAVSGRAQQASVTALPGGPAVPNLKNAPKPPAPHKAPAPAPISAPAPVSTVSHVASAPPSHPSVPTHTTVVTHNSIGGSPPSNGNGGSVVAHGGF